MMAAGRVAAKAVAAEFNLDRKSGGLGGAVNSARVHGASWSAVGGAVGTTKRAAWERWH